MRSGARILRRLMKVENRLHVRVVTLVPFHHWCLEFDEARPAFAESRRFHESLMPIRNIGPFADGARHFFNDSGGGRGELMQAHTGLASDIASVLLRIRMRRRRDEAGRQS